jgi:diamine N-acetyltransferase
LPIINITGEQVMLGPLERETCIALEYRSLNDFATLRSRWEAAPAPATIERAIRMYEQQVADGDGSYFLIYERASGEAIGTLGLQDINYRNRTAEYGITISDARHRGKGYGTEATRLALDYAFTTLGLHNVLLTTVSFNPGALRAYARAGFREIGRRHGCWLMGGTYYDEVSMEALSTDFESPVLKEIFVPDDVRS